MPMVFVEPPAVRSARVITPCVEPVPVSWAVSTSW